MKGLVSSRDPQALLFPGPDGRMIGSINKLWDRLAELGQLPAVRAHMLCHTYCATRLQTLDRGYPVSEFVVSREMGHGSMNLVHRIYGHVQNRRGRFPAVRYCLSDWPKLRRQVRALPKRLAERVAARDAALSEGTAAAGRASGQARADGRPRTSTSGAARERTLERRAARAQYMREYRKRTSA